MKFAVVSRVGETRFRELCHVFSGEDRDVFCDRVNGDSLIPRPSYRDLDIKLNLCRWLSAIMSSDTDVDFANEPINVGCYRVWNEREIQ